MTAAAIPAETPQETRAARLFLAAIAAYLAAQVILRTILGGTFEPDEAEMVILARGFHIANGSQTPLYEWIQAASFRIFGFNTFGLVFPKNIVHFVAYTALFASLRGRVPLPLAMAGTVSLLFLPNFGWEAQRSGSHTSSAVAMTLVTLWAFLRLADRRDLAAYLLFGLAVGLGGLAKPNFWMVPPALLLAGLTLPAVRPAVLDRRMVPAVLVAFAVVALPYGRMLADPLPTFSDTWEFAKDDYAWAPFPWVSGLARLLAETAGSLLPLILVLAIAFALGQGRRADLVAGDPARLMLRAALIGLGLVALAVVVAGVAFVRARWLLPLYLLAAPALTVTLLGALGPRATRNILRGAALLACLYLIGIADLRLRGAGSDSLRIAPLAEAIEAAQPAGTPVPPIVAEHYYTGNLALIRPDWVYFPPYPTRRLTDAPPPAELILIGRDEPRGLAKMLAEHGLADPARFRVIEARDVALPYRFEKSGKVRTVPMVRVEILPAAQ